MPSHEYKVVPAPTRPEKAKGGKSTAEKFALSLTSFMNEYGRDGWEYVRAETLPCEVKKGLFGRSDTTFQTLLVFRRDAGENRADHQASVEAAKAQKVVRRLWARDAAQPAVAAAPVPAPAAPPVPAGLTASAPEGSAPRIFAAQPERRDPVQD